MNSSALPIAAAGLVAILTTPGAAQQGGSAFAAAAAANQAPEVCIAEGAEKAQACALGKCQAKAGGACLITDICAPAGWGGIIQVVLGNGQMFETVCGAPGRREAVAALRGFCRGHLPGVQSCTLTVVYSPQAKEFRRTRTWNAADLQKAGKKGAKDADEE